MACNSPCPKCLVNLPVDGAGGGEGEVVGVGWGVGGVGAVTQVKVLGLCHCRFTVMHLCVDTHQGRGYLAVRSNLA